MGGRLGLSSGTAKNESFESFENRSQHSHASANHVPSVCCAGDADTKRKMKLSLWCPALKQMVKLEYHLTSDSNLIKSIKPYYCSAQTWCPVRDNGECRLGKTIQTQLP